MEGAGRTDRARLIVMRSQGVTGTSSIVMEEEKKISKNSKSPEFLKGS